MGLVRVVVTVWAAGFPGALVVALILHLETVKKYQRTHGCSRPVAVNALQTILDRVLWQARSPYPLTLGEAWLVAALVWPVSLVVLLRAWTRNSQ